MLSSRLGQIVGRYVGGVITARIYASEFMLWRSDEIQIGGRLSDLPVVSELFTDINDYCADYIPSPWDPLWISEAEMRHRLMTERIPALEELFGKGVVEVQSPDDAYLARREQLARRIGKALVDYAGGTTSSGTFIADIYAIQADGDRWQVFHELFDTAYSDAAALEMGSPDVGSDSYGRDAKMLAAERARTLQGTFL
ncbi:hypothetical protein FZI91_07340 [Mycobacterium sp. CBMA271]|uniref:hypothetical protein n=1 Tax=unclassified Mycobacteroides TaxID=2618759 RepID=UPI0012DD0BCE|nr:MULTISPECIES: hypothetical protein [unclassified Mycobacteroides]MUM19105.1 hypothetical protein [Mycobacteroides sp. CBMA 326]MUM21519.1 hypothetical protein [Mycobacteroides sp. CBMA 271]